MTDIQQHWQEITFLMMGGWIGWLSMLVFQLQNAPKVLEMQIAFAAVRI